MGCQFSIPVLWSFCSGSVEAYSFKILVDDSDTGSLGSITVRKEYLFAFQFWYVSYVWKTNEGEAESIVLLIFDSWRCFNCRWVTGGGLCQKVLFRTSGFSRGFSQSNKHDTFWYVVSSGYFYVLFLWAIVVSAFCPLEI